MNNSSHPEYLQVFLNPATASFISMSNEPHFRFSGRSIHWFIWFFLSISISCSYLPEGSWAGHFPSFYSSRLGITLGSSGSGKRGFWRSLSKTKWKLKEEAQTRKFSKSAIHRGLNPPSPGLWVAGTEKAAWLPPAAELQVWETCQKAGAVFLNLFQHIQRCWRINLWC